MWDRQYDNKITLLVYVAKSFLNCTQIRAYGIRIHNVSSKLIQCFSNTIRDYDKPYLKCEDILIAAYFIWQCCNEIHNKKWENHKSYSPLTKVIFPLKPWNFMAMRRRKINFTSFSLSSSQLCKEPLQFRCANIIRDESHTNGDSITRNKMDEMLL